MSKLHELLAVETDLEGVHKKVVEEAIVTFSKKPEHFLGQTKVLEMFDEAKKNENTSEFKEMVTTVGAKLDYVAGHVIRYFDAVYQKEKANQSATADLIVDGAVVAEKVPATFLLGMETKLKNLRAMYEGIPTLAPGFKWEENDTLGKGVFETAHPDIKFKTAKQFKSQIIVQPTKEHPAQVEKWAEDVPVGKYTTSIVCGMLTPARKSELIGRVDKLIQACKQARQRANCVEVESVVIGKKLIDFINS